MRHKYVSEDGSLQELSMEESALFEHLINLMKSTESNFNDIEQLISNNPFLCKAVHGQHGYTALALAIDTPSYKGTQCFEELLKKGANIYFEYQKQTLMQKVQYGNNVIFSKSLKQIAYNYADNERDRSELDIVRFLQEHKSGDETAPATESSEVLVVVKESGEECCIVSMLLEGRYDIEIYNHPKFSVMLKAANDLGVLQDFMSVLEDNYFAEQLPIAIAERKQELINYQRSMGANEEILKEIDNAIEDLSIEQVLRELYSANEQPQGNGYSFEAFFNDVLNNLKLISFNAFQTIQSGHAFYYSFPGGSPDDFGGNLGGSVASFDGTKDNATVVGMVSSLNYTNLKAMSDI